MTRQFGLIGFPLSHSFSPGYFNNKFSKENIDAVYRTYPLENISDFVLLKNSYPFEGLNVTIPYKQAILPFLDEVDENAQEIGAVNTIKIYQGKSKGFNTDVFGFEQSLLSFIGSPNKIHQALVLGTGGASKAIQFTLKKLNIPFLLVSRGLQGDCTYSELNEERFKTSNLIINTTPLGMSPNENNKPDIPYQWLNEKYFLYDLIYNPEKTIFLSEGLKKGCKIKNGYEMLILQAEKAWQIWNQKEI